MDFKKFLMGGIIGGVVNFLLGWLVWGVLLMDLMRKHSTHMPGVFRGKEDMVWWAIIAGNIAFGFLVVYVLLKGNIKTAGGGASAGFMLGLLSCAGFDLIMYAQMTTFGRAAMAIDVVAAAIVTAVVGAVVGWFLGRGETAS